MSSQQESIPPYLDSRPLARQHRGSGNWPRWPNDRPTNPVESLHFIDRSIAIGQLDCDPLSISEIFKEELVYRAQARSFLWEFFD